VGHQPALITSLPFVHTARHYYRLNELVRSLDCGRFHRPPREADQTCLFRGSKSRNKVSVGEPAEGSFMFFFVKKTTLVNWQGDLVLPIKTMQIYPIKNDIQLSATDL
jgi:hypothetical protein